MEIKERLIHLGEWALPPPFRALFLQAVQQDLYVQGPNEYQWVLRREGMYDIFFWMEFIGMDKFRIMAWQWTRRNDWDPNFWDQTYFVQGG